MKIQSLDIGLDRISEWNVSDEFHLPGRSGAATAFIPQFRPLDEVLRRPSLDERLPDLLLPAAVDPELLEPSVLTDTREDLRRLFAESAARAHGNTGEVFAAAARLLQHDEALDAEVRAALALLLRG